MWERLEAQERRHMLALERLMHEQREQMLKVAVLFAGGDAAATEASQANDLDKCTRGGPDGAEDVHTAEELVESERLLCQTGAVACEELGGYRAKGDGSPNHPSKDDGDASGHESDNKRHDGSAVHLAGGGGGNHVRRLTRLFDTCALAGGGTIVEK